MWNPDNKQNTRPPKEGDKIKSKYKRLAEEYRELERQYWCKEVTAEYKQQRKAKAKEAEWQKALAEAEHKEDQALLDLHNLKQGLGESAETVIRCLKHLAALAGLSLEDNDRLPQISTKPKSHQQTLPHARWANWVC